VLQKSPARKCPGWWKPGQVRVDMLGAQLNPGGAMLPDSRPGTYKMKIALARLGPGQSLERLRGLRTTREEHEA